MSQNTSSPLNLPSRNNETDLICEAFESEKCYILGNELLGKMADALENPEERCCISVDFCLSPGIKSVCLGMKNKLGLCYFVNKSRAFAQGRVACQSGCVSH